MIRRIGYASREEAQERAKLLSDTGVSVRYYPEQDESGRRIWIVVWDDGNIQASKVSGDIGSQIESKPHPFAVPIPESKNENSISSEPNTREIGVFAGAYEHSNRFVRSIRALPSKGKMAQLPNGLRRRPRKMRGAI